MVAEMPFYSWTRDQIAETLVSSLTYESKAIDQLANTATDIVIEFMDTAFEDDAVRLANLIQAIGNHMFEQLQQFNAYTNGYLFYQYHGWCDADIVLGRFTPEEVSLHRWHELEFKLPRHIPTY